MRFSMDESARRDEDLPILLFYYTEVLASLEDRRTTTSRKVSRTAVLEAFLKTKHFQKTADRFGVSRATINDIIYRAFRTAMIGGTQANARLTGRCVRIGDQYFTDQVYSG